MTALAPTLQTFFTDRLIRQRNASPHTITSYRDTWRLLLGFAAERTGRSPSELDIADLDAPLIAAFLDHLEHDRGNTIRTRNTRLAAIHSLFRFAALNHPEHAGGISRVLAIEPKRCDHAIVNYLTDPEVDALLQACDQSTWTGRRDHTMLVLDVQTGLRISELIALTRGDVHLGAGPHIACHGKGRKDRVTPLTPTTRDVLRSWLKEVPSPPQTPILSTRQGRPMSRDAIEHRITLYTQRASTAHSSLANKTVTAHVLRHTAAMRLLHAGVDISVIALWLGHASSETTQIYLHADMTIKQKALDRTRPIGARHGRYKPPDALLAWLEAL